MTEMYVILVIEKKRTCDPKNTSVPVVPAMCRDSVIAELTARGYDANGNKVA